MQATQAAQLSGSVNYFVFKTEEQVFPVLSCIRRHDLHALHCSFLLLSGKLTLRVVEYCINGVVCSVCMLADAT